MTSLPEHGHCENCGDPCAFGEYFCSDECSKEYAADVREAKRLDRRFFIVLGAIIVGVAVGAYLLKTFVL